MSALLAHDDDLATQAIDMTALLAEQDRNRCVTATTSPPSARTPTEWHRRGMTAPAELDRMISERLGAQFSSTARSAFEPSYADFFTAA